MGEKRNTYRDFVGKYEAKSIFLRPRRRWEDRNNMNLKEIGRKTVEWIYLAQDKGRW
jgi:hypothetical protein